MVVLVELMMRIDLVFLFWREIFGFLYLLECRLMFLYIFLFVILGSWGFCEVSFVVCIRCFDFIVCRLFGVFNFMVYCFVVWLYCVDWIWDEVIMFKLNFLIYWWIWFVSLFCVSRCEFLRFLLYVIEKLESGRKRMRKVLNLCR